MLKAIVVDDEPAGRRAIARLIASTPMLSFAGEASSVAAGIALIKNCQPDVAFIDIEMAGGDGFEIATSLPQPPKIVVVTAHANYAARAFDVEVADFLLKPVEAHRFARTVQRLHTLPARKAAEPRQKPGLLSIPVPGGQRVVLVHDILAVLAEGDESRLLLAGNTELRVRRSIGAFAGSLPSPLFQRVSRSVVLNLECLSGIQAITRYQTRVTLRGHTQEVRLGATAAATLRRYFDRL